MSNIFLKYVKRRYLLREINVFFQLIIFGICWDRNYIFSKGETVAGRRP